ncbi:hypothetical protein QR78_14175 [Methylobacterium indicum]|uniref:Uncharacterized protein n=2 Tax=Methylobacterium indicum TaxID=1775910 RepID=A0ABR5HES5_9HYPH|nr:hypothetical protein QR78_14175 [Methylobacterium indicum]KMO25063.1 hypothetical protein QR79_09565 [Methylobacterium indicum]
MQVQYWLAQLDQHGNATLVDGAHSTEQGAHRALYLFQALGLGKGDSYAVARVELIKAVPDGRDVNHDAVGIINRARAAGIPVQGGDDGR